MRTQARSLASLRGLRILHCHVLRCRLQMWLRFDVAVGCGIGQQLRLLLNPWPGTSMCHGFGPKKKRKEKEKGKKKKGGTRKALSMYLGTWKVPNKIHLCTWQIFVWPQLWFRHWSRPQSYSNEQNRQKNLCPRGEYTQLHILAKLNDASDYCNSVCLLLIAKYVQAHQKPEARVTR